nr:MAG TPA: hypothetical protein [Caudoviricetes sp.]
MNFLSLEMSYLQIFSKKLFRKFGGVEFSTYLFSVKEDEPRRR